LAKMDGYDEMIAGSDPAFWPPDFKDLNLDLQKMANIVSKLGPEAVAYKKKIDVRRRGLSM
jgi:hypothetical protein